MTSTVLSAARVLIAVDAGTRVGIAPVSEQDLSDLIYFIDAFSTLWGIRPLKQARSKGSGTRIQFVRDALNVLVVSQLVTPHDVHALDGAFRASYTASADARRVIERVAETGVGRREIACTDEVVLAAAPLLDGRLGEATRLDATTFNDVRGPADVIDFLDNEAPTTTGTAHRFAPAVASKTKTIAELTHLYMQHLDRVVTNG